MLGTTTDNSRQLLHRAKARLARGTAAADRHGAVEARDRRTLRPRVLVRRRLELTALLAEDVGMWSDGGGKASAARRPLIGRDQVLNFLVGLHRTAQTAGTPARCVAEDRRRQLRACPDRAGRAAPRVDLRVLHRRRRDFRDPRRPQSRQARAHRSSAHDVALTLFEARRNGIDSISSSRGDQQCGIFPRQGPADRWCFCTESACRTRPGARSRRICRHRAVSSRSTLPDSA